MRENDAIYDTRQIMREYLRQRREYLANGGKDTDYLDGAIAACERIILMLEAK